EYPTGGGISGPNYIVAGPDGNLWYTKYFTNKIARSNTAGTFLGDLSIPTTPAQPEAIAVGSDGNFWSVSQAGHRGDPRDARGRGRGLPDRQQRGDVRDHRRARRQRLVHLLRDGQHRTRQDRARSAPGRPDIVSAQGLREGGRGQEAQAQEASRL